MLDKKSITSSATLNLYSYLLVTFTNSSLSKSLKDFSGVGKLTLAVTSADIFAAGIVINGTFNITTNSLLHAQDLRKTLHWYLDSSGGKK